MVLSNFVDDAALIVQFNKKGAPTSRSAFD